MRSSLRSLFNNKCAYCECVISHVSYEHWRPKNALKDVPVHKGYYWLASDWSNLLLACSICNGAANKGTRFPILPSSQYSFCSTDLIAGEEPLLINPCIEDPTIHFNYTRLGMIELLTEKGAVSVEVYGLNRQELFIERKKWAGVVTTLLDDIKINIKRRQASWFQCADLAEIDYTNSSIESKKAQLKEYTMDSFQYAGMIRHLITEFCENNIENNELISITKELIE